MLSSLFGALVKRRNQQEENNLKILKTNHIGDVLYII